jgi:hypothetical protein
MAMMDDMKSKLSNMSDDMRARYQELKSKEDSSDLDDKGRQELQQIRNRMKGKGNQ